MFERRSTREDAREIGAQQLLLGVSEGPLAELIVDLAQSRLVFDRLFGHEVIEVLHDHEHLAGMAGPGPIG